ncbi:hypothetical protein SPHINGO8AM_30554 [Sphingomonas sp. 8AM]|nr:hypothetical protein SPHINGO8AM_30554 [Sphingomonas sp. 8AM]
MAKSRRPGLDPGPHFFFRNGHWIRMAWNRLTFVIASVAKQSRAEPGRPGLLRYARNDDSAWT